MVVLETLYFGKVFSQKTKLSLIPVCLGVLLTSATDIQFNLIGTTFFLFAPTPFLDPYGLELSTTNPLAGAVYAFLGVLITSMYQIVR